MNLPDAEALCEELARKLRAGVTGSTGLVGIRTGGAWLAERLHRELKLATPLGTLDISFYRDDFGTAGLRHQVKPSQIPFEVNDRHIVVVDDVLYTGRTVRAAMNELFDYGRPGRIELAVLVDRGERQLPIAAQYIGATLAVPQGKLLRLARDDRGKFSLRLSDAKPSA
ncbi:MAG: bifunctional pyr operon transcriptional regulator/uracil phosphoribosyltransferase PyrR [Betaproteobacteria bacterium]|nr:MAG: bifunctional pyr operon transcriptional regulator/uracil phosphoribosyltransferase PyrR [Betaproteobacteria bacterium]